MHQAGRAGDPDVALDGQVEERAEQPGATGAPSAETERYRS
jgi:hypothetical protein